MQDDQFDDIPNPSRRRVRRVNQSSGNTWLWALGTIGGVVLLGCLGCCGLFAYIGSVSPETHVYIGSDVPASYVKQMQGLGALEAGEQIRFFYSDAAIDIEEGFYFVSDRGVVVYGDEREPKLTRAAFADIESLYMFTNEDDWEDGEIAITLKDGSEIYFPISSELGRDDDFFNAIREGAPEAAWEIENIDTMDGAVTADPEMLDGEAPAVPVEESTN